MSRERVEQAERIKTQYKEELDRRQEQLEAHKNFRDGQPSTQEEIDEHVRKRQQLEAQVATAEQQYKEAQAQYEAEKARQEQVEAEQRRAEEEMDRNGYGSRQDQEIREEQERRANEERWYQAEEERHRERIRYQAEQAKRECPSHDHGEPDHDNSSPSSTHDRDMGR